ncbi:hypothetical protein V5799_017075 [Amblyomma americanum]|uniref:M13 family peptidase n=1 Tax=Amblyomma americanum TaxID=6943 RepID=A0AAQ4F3E2_AMBAM
MGSEPCQATSRIHYGNLVRLSANHEVHPCDDYYSHVCGYWHKTGRLTVAKAIWHQFLTRAMLRVAGRADHRPGSLTGMATRYIRACLRPLEHNNVIEVRLVLSTGGIHWPSLPTRADFLFAVFYMARRVHSPVFFDVHEAEDGAQRLMTITRDKAFEMMDAKLTELVNNAYAEEHYRVCCEAFAIVPGSVRRCPGLYEDFVKMKGFLDNRASNVTETTDELNATHLLRHTPSVSGDRWADVVQYYFSASLSSLRVRMSGSLKQFTSAFLLHEHFGEEKALDLVGWLAVQVLIHYTNSTLIESFYRDPDVAIEEHHQRCFTTAYVVYGYAVNRLFMKDSDANVIDVVSFANNISTTFKNVLRNGTLLRSGFFPELRTVDVDRTFQILKASLAASDDNLSLPQLGNRPLKNKMRLGERDKPVILAYGASDPTVFDGFQMSPQHLNAPWNHPDALPSALLGGLGMRLAGSLFVDYIKLSRMFQHNYKENQKCLDPEGVSDSFGLDLQAAAASVNVALSLQDSRYSSASNQPFFDDRVALAFACWLLCGDEERGRVMCNTPMKHSPYFARAFGCVEGSPMNPSVKCVMKV